MRDIDSAPTGSTDTGSTDTGSTDTGSTGSGTVHLFVYGTLRPGESRWRHLQPYVVDDGFVDAAVGRLYDTGQGYPAAMFGEHDTAGPTVIRGHTFGLLENSLAQALDHLDAVEGAVRGLYRRIVVSTTAGVQAFAYEYGGGLDLAPITSGDWLQR
jgi:gamma-glutamylcyclotransferase (GGCT)/AIG2-like uncharacterized protein YtfP